MTNSHKRQTVHANFYIKTPQNVRLHNDYEPTSWSNNFYGHSTDVVNDITMDVMNYVQILRALHDFTITADDNDNSTYHKMSSKMQPIQILCASLKFYACKKLNESIIKQRHAKNSSYLLIRYKNCILLI